LEQVVLVLDKSATALLKPPAVVPVVLMQDSITYRLASDKFFISTLHALLLIQQDQILSQHQLRKELWLWVVVKAHSRQAECLSKAQSVTLHSQVVPEVMHSLHVFLAEAAGEQQDQVALDKMVVMEILTRAATMAVEEAVVQMAERQLLVLTEVLLAVMVAMDQKDSLVLAVVQRDKEATAHWVQVEVAEIMDKMAVMVVLV
jgi:hypothetical protein